MRSIERISFDNYEDNYILISSPAVSDCESMVEEDFWVFEDSEFVYFNLKPYEERWFNCIMESKGVEHRIDYLEGYSVDTVIQFQIYQGIIFFFAFIIFVLVLKGKRKVVKRLLMFLVLCIVIFISVKKW